MDRISPDPYSILGLPRNATEGQIRGAYRRFAMRFHPDLNPDNLEAEERFREVQSAYEALLGRDGQKIACRREFCTAPFAKSDQPFCDFFSTMRAHYAKERDSGEG